MEHGAQMAYFRKSSDFSSVFRTLISLSLAPPLSSCYLSAAIHLILTEFQTIFNRSCSVRGKKHTLLHTHTKHTIFSSTTFSFCLFPYQESFIPPPTSFCPHFQSFFNYCHCYWPSISITESSHAQLSTPLILLPSLTLHMWYPREEKQPGHEMQSHLGATLSAGLQG